MKKKFKMSVLVLGLVFIVFNLIILLFGQADTEMVNHGVLENTFSTTAYLFKDEILVSTNDGVLKPMASDGERIKKGARIGAVLTADTNESALYEFLRIEDRMKKLDSIAPMVEQTQTLRTDEQITNISREITVAADTGDLSTLRKMKDDLLRFKDEKTAANGQKNDLMHVLSERRDTLHPQIGNHIKEIYSPEAGILFLQADGYEETMSLKASENITPSTFAKLENTTYSNGTSCKIMKSGEWRFAFLADERHQDLLQKSKTLRIRLHDLGGIIISTDIISVSQPEDGKIAVVVSSYQTPEGFLSRRKMHVDIILGRYEGLKVSSKAIQTENGEKGVYVKTVTDEVFKPVEILYENESTVIIKENTAKNGTLRLYDTVIF